jgi:hypothetical protein
MNSTPAHSSRLIRYLNISLRLVRLGTKGSVRSD